MIDSADLVIVGGGCIGCSTAFHAAKLDPSLKIILLERQHVAWGMTGRSTAIVRQHYSNPETAGMALESLKVFENFREAVGGDAGFTRTGFTLAVGSKDEEALRRNVEMQRSLGIETSVLEPGELKKFQPDANVDGLAAAAYEPRSGYADPVATTQSFAKAAEKLGVKVLERTKVLEILQSAGKVSGVRTEKGEIAASRVVNAANVWANQIMPRGHSKLPIRVLKEQSCIFLKPQDFTAKLTVWGDFPSGFYFCPKGPDRLLTGSLESNLPEVADPDNCEGVDYETVTVYSQKLVNRFPAMARGRWERGWSGAYDVTPDWHPILDESSEVEGLYIAAGFSGHGFKLSPAVGKRMAQFVTSGNKPEDLALFSADRFSKGKALTGHYESSIIA
ncbi:MAG: NAD(P)/FAD-dependent oxidoreductase [Candidatus Bathyarchaeia archaeon]